MPAVARLRYGAAVSDRDAIEIRLRHHVTISPIFVEQYGPTTTLRWRGTGVARRLHDHATDEEIVAAVRAWEAEVSARPSPTMDGILGATEIVPHDEPVD